MWEHDPEGEFGERDPTDRHKFDERDKILSLFEEFNFAYFLCGHYHFNFYLDPPCSCVHLDLASYKTGECRIDDLHLIRDHIKDARSMFLTFRGGSETSPEACGKNKATWDLVRSLSKLKVVHFQTLPLAELPESFKQLDIIGISFANPYIEKIDIDMINSWHHLETFSCVNCPVFDARSLLEADLPRLSTLELYGVAQCPENNALKNADQFKCVVQHKASICPQFPQWLLEYRVDQAAAATKTGCFQPTCSDRIQDFTLPLYNQDDNGFMGAEEFSTYVDKRFVLAGTSDRLRLPVPAVECTVSSLYIYIYIYISIQEII